MGTRLLRAAASLLIASPLLAPALDWRPGAGFRSAPLDPGPSHAPGFSALPAQNTGINFTNHLADRSAALNRIYEVGSGVALGDVDGDGLCDIYLCRLEGPNILYRNLGNWRFEDVTSSAGVACDGQYSTGAALADIDGDGDLDLLVNSIGGGTRAFLNDGKGRFSELTGTRLVRRFGSTSLGLADIDGDGDLDLYVTNYRTDTYKDRPPGLKVDARMVGGKIVVTPENRFVPLTPRGGGVEVMELGERDFLYLNDGAGHFSPASWTAGSFLDEDGKALTAAPLDWGLSVMLRDLNGDGAPDIYVCNDFFYSPDRIWLNEASRRFRAAPRQSFRSISLASMAVDVGDLNRDGLDDILVVDMLSRSHQFRQRQRPNMMKGLLESPVTNPDFRPETPRNTLFLNRGDGTYAEIAQLTGLAATEWSWSTILLDVDLDGYEDVLVGTGNNHDVLDADALRQLAGLRGGGTAEERLALFPRLETANLAFRNQGDLTFADRSREWGFDLKGISHGMAVADLDNDGDLDVVVNRLNAPPLILRNESTAPRVAVRLLGRAPNTRGIGARIRLLGGAVATQGQEMVCGGRYLSSDDNIRTFAAGSTTNRMRLEVRWRNGRQSVVDNVEANRIYEIAEPDPSSPVVPEPTPPPTLALFQDVSDALTHIHVDHPFDDMARQPLLTHRLSQLGPGVGWIDLDGDGREDLIVGAGEGGKLAVFRNEGAGRFSRQDQETPAARDQTGIVAWNQSTGRSMALVATSNWEETPPQPSEVLAFDAQARPATEKIAQLGASSGPLAIGNLHGAGRLDLFIGGRLSPGRHPEPVASQLLRDTGGRFETDTPLQTALAKVGMVSGAVFSDLDGDGTAELILACEWGPIRVFRREGGALMEITEKLGLSRYTGWWNGVVAGDFDGDGRMDLAASNWGRNTKYQAVLAQPLRMFYGDFNSYGNIVGIEAYTDHETGRIVPWRDLETMAKAIPFIQGQFGTFRAYGAASVQEMLETKWAEATELRATTLDSMVFLNRGDHFEAVSLPMEAQFAPAFGITVADFNGDGREDLFLAQNFFEVEPETSRYDAGRGQLLLGDGKGGFTAASGAASGILIYGEQRGCAAADFDGDGRTDLVVAQNNGATRLLHNTTAKPGLRVRLTGPPENPNAVGAVMRLKFGEQLGAARELHAGSGYWSQDAFTSVLGGVAQPTALWVRWPGGAESTTAIEPGAKELRVSAPRP